MLTYTDTYLRLLKLYKDTGAGHMGGGISVLPAVYVLLNEILETDRDLLVFSKGHTVAALYCTLFACGYIFEQELMSFYSSDGTRFGGHVPSHLFQFIPFATGSLGHGPSLACGLALAKRYKKESGIIYCICGDGEWQEGACWEALAFAVHHKLNNIVFYIDCNGWQGFGSVQSTVGHGDDMLAEKISSFGAKIIRCDGENPKVLSDIFIRPLDSSFPSVILAKTTKGKGLLDYENTLDSHYIQMNDVLYKRVMKNLESNKCEKV